MPFYDLIIIGGGPAGLTAGIYGARARLKTAILEKGALGGMAFTTRDLLNYPGFFQHTSGPELMKAMVAHAAQFGVDIIKENVVDLVLEGDTKIIKTKKGHRYETNVIILACGCQPRSLNIPGEKALRGCGVSYCATCDAEFYENQTVVVVGNGDSAIEEALFITKFASKVIIIVIHDEGVVDCNMISAEKAFKNKKIEFIWNSVLTAIKGQDEVEGVVIKNLKTGVLCDLPADGVFIYVGMIPATEILQGKLDLDKAGYINTNEMMETSVDGVYAAGDIRIKFLRQVITAANDGAVAAVAAERFISEHAYFQKYVLDSTKLLLLFFWNPEVDQCFVAMSLLLQATAEHKALIEVVKVDISRKKKIAQRYGVNEIPAAILLQNGKVICNLCPISQDTWAEEINRILSV